MLIEAVAHEIPVGQLPLSDLAARRLTLALLQSQTSQAVDAIKPIEFVYDPALCIWCLTAQPVGRKIPTLRDLSNWWQRADWDPLRWRVQGGFGVPAESMRADLDADGEAAAMKRGAKLARESAQAAWATAHTAQQLLDDPRVTRALLFNYRDWVKPVQGPKDWGGVEAARLGNRLDGTSTRKLLKRARRTKLPSRIRRGIQQAWSHEHRQWREALGLTMGVGAQARVGETLQREKLASLRELAYGASHEINNPLTNISLRAQNLLRVETDPKRRRDLKAINDQVFRAHEMIADLMLFAKPPTLERQPVEPSHLIDAVIEQIREQADEKSVRIIRSLTKSLPQLLADPTQLQVALAAICKNALESLDETGGQIRLHAIQTILGGERFVLISVEDDGPGVPESLRKHIFDPFFSGREAGRGLGFGLSKAWRIVSDHGGRLWLDATENGHTCFLVELPSTTNDSPT